MENNLTASLSNIDPLTLAIAAFGVALICTVSLYLKLQTARMVIARAEAKLAAMNERETSLTQMQQHTVDAAKSAALEVSQHLSNKLLADHKRENEAAKEASVKQTTQTTKALTEQMQKMQNGFAAITDQHIKNSTQLANITKTLTTPAGAGQLSEIGLENLLKAFGLEKGRDFDMQVTVSGEKILRPDAMIYLPHGRVMVIDSKASKFLMEVANAPDSDTLEAAYSDLKNTMNTHLKALAVKDYRAAIAKDMKARGSELTDIWSVMYVPTEAAVEHIRQADATFSEKLLNADIILAGPGSLHGLLSMARMQIEGQRQLENSTHIIEAAREVMDGVIRSFVHLEKVSGSIKNSAEHFDKFARSANRFLLPKLHKMAPMGVTPPRGKTLPNHLTSYEVRANEQVLIEAEASEAEEQTLSLVE